MFDELEANPAIVVERAELRPPLSEAELTKALEDAAWVKGELAAAVRELWSSCDGFVLQWSLGEVPAGVDLAPDALEGHFELLGLADFLDNAMYLDGLGDMGSPEDQARVSRLHPVSLDDMGYASALADDDPSAVIFVGDDGVETRSEMDLLSYVDRAIRCRGARHFGSITAGKHAGADALRELLQKVFADSSATEIPGLAAPPSDPLDALCQKAQRAFAKHDIPAKVFRGRKGDPCGVYAVFPDGWSGADTLEAAMKEVFPKNSVRSVGIQIGELALKRQVEYDLGVIGKELAPWVLMHGVLAGEVGRAEADARIAALVARSRQKPEFSRADQLRSDLLGVQDLLTLLDPSTDEEMRELAMMSAAEWKDRAGIAEATKAARLPAAQRKVIDAALAGLDGSA